MSIGFLEFDSPGKACLGRRKPGILTGPGLSCFLIAVGRLHLALSGVFRASGEVAEGAPGCRGRLAGVLQADATAGAGCARKPMIV